MLGPAETAEQRESVSIAVLTLMERLAAKERAVYVLRESFGYAHGEIAEVLDLTEANCQQLYRRAKQHLATDRPRPAVDAAAARKVVEEFLAAALSGKTDSLVRLLTDAIAIGDGGAVVFSVPQPITGALRVARFLRTLFTPSEAKWAMIGGRPDLFAAVANGVPALVMVVGDRVAGVFALDVTADGIAAVHAQANPAELARATGRWAGSAAGEPLTGAWPSGCTPPAPKSPSSTPIPSSSSASACTSSRAARTRSPAC
ncbi:sigma factor-like helix-turn-helix DNA-binding protein [Amycolatopsis sp. cg9]|uniref:sigma factor-like helix-turn-helix DNA-binding protein n=1 Tax=Amycolatopsis sp. cg9 TaxID=3238801 RepID=UPI0035266BD6